MWDLSIDVRKARALVQHVKVRLARDCNSHLRNKVIWCHVAQTMVQTDGTGYTRLCVYACIQTNKHTYIHTYIRTCMHACIHTYIHTCMHACMHACKNTYMNTYIKWSSFFMTFRVCGFTSFFSLAGPLNNLLGRGRQRPAVKLGCIPGCDLSVVLGGQNQMRSKRHP